jgi:hypothetical protein
MFKIGDCVRIKENAFPGSDDPYDIAARGKVGTIIASWANDLGEGWKDCWEVEIEGLGGIFPVTESEIELA